MWNEQQFSLYGTIQTSQTGGQPYSDTSSYGEWSLAVSLFIGLFGYNWSIQKRKVMLFLSKNQSLNVNYF